MNLDFITEMFIPVVMAACLVVGFILKKWVPGDNKWIPTILVIFGAALGCVANAGVTLEYIVDGAVTGLASTGLHQVFKQLLGIDASESTDDKLIDETEAEALIQADMGATAKESEEAEKAAAEKSEG